MRIFTLVSKNRIPPSMLFLLLGQPRSSVVVAALFPQKTFVNEYKKAFPSQKDGKAVVPPSLVLLRPTLSPVT
ncbi:hypothetical protein H131_14488 [Lysinibacillus sphaericus OT4b.31]|uniref:Uncharacterized protein n=1 Tax=Lysinibacillus sphaericus OT4b.31 TaxID=1285586 RepID=R7ZCG0_LYSSH|nr:hypothetical protein H131_14488 [Lysinibacillus sphaericus OT4b.31]